MREIALLSGKLYTAGTIFTRPSNVTVATNLNSAQLYVQVHPKWKTFTTLYWRFFPKATAGWVILPPIKSSNNLPCTPILSLTSLWSLSLSFLRRSRSCNLALYKVVHQLAHLLALAFAHDCALLHLIKSGRVQLGRYPENQNGNLRWHLPLGVRPPTPLNGTNFQTFFYPTFFFCNWILHIWNRFYTSKISLWSPLIIDIHQQFWPLTANYLAMFKVISTTLYT